MPLEGCFLIGEFLRDFWQSWFFDSEKISLRKCLRIPAQQRLTGFRCISPSLSCENQQIHQVLIIRHLNRAISTSENDHLSPPVFSHCPNCLNPQDEQSCERLQSVRGISVWQSGQDSSFGIQCCRQLFHAFQWLLGGLSKKNLSAKRGTLRETTWSLPFFGWWCNETNLGGCFSWN